MTKDQNKYNLEERTTKFSEAVIDLCKTWPKTQISLPIINQLIRSATSIGANYFEANGASSKRDFKSKIFICKKEARETKYWLRLMLKTTNNDKQTENSKKLSQEAKELTLIFSKIAINTK